MEKMALSLVIASMKLHPYFQAHTIKVMTDQPTKKVKQARRYWLSNPTSVSPAQCAGSFCELENNQLNIIIHSIRQGHVVQPPSFVLLAGILSIKHNITPFKINSNYFL